MGTINIITGSWDVGKTKRLIDRYNGFEGGTAGGFASVKVYDKETGEFTGYALKGLGTGKEYPQAILKKACNEEPVDTLVFDRFVFSNETFRLAEKILEDLTYDERINAIFLDEIGPIELSGLGFNAILEKLLKSSKDIYIAVNEKNLQEVTRKYKIEEFNSI